MAGRGQPTRNRRGANGRVLPNGSDTIARVAVLFVATAFFLITTGVSWLRWANFQYRTFDLAYYVQAMWQLIHGRLEVTVQHVPLLGNHVEPIVLLFAPLFALFRHPMLFVIVQNAALAAMAPVGYLIARRFFNPATAALLGVALLLTPATGYVAMHEFHPEALTAPLLLLMVYSRMIRRLWLHWLCLAGVLACKENMALLVVAYCGVFMVLERKSSRAERVRWFAAPLAVAVLWFVICTAIITPVFNSGNIDYLGLYDRLGKNAPEILWNMVTRPQLAGSALGQALGHGNLVWALLLPFLGLPLLRPRWLLIATPILLQHLLSWRSSEWQIYFHYAAPMIPLFWIGAVEALVRLNAFFKTEPALVTAAAVFLFGCIFAQAWVGPARMIISELSQAPANRDERARKQALVDRIPATASVVAPLPYLSHLAMREKLYSLHYILKGLKTLSRERYQPPPPTDFVLIDYNDSATFDKDAGYYHPQMRTRDGDIVPSSDQLLQEFLSQAKWEEQSANGIVLLRRKAH